MGITILKVTVRNLAQPRRKAEIECVVDSGVILSIIPAKLLRTLGIRPDRSEEFTLADGSHARRRLADALFEMGDRRGSSPVIAGQKGDATVIGAVTLEAMGMMLDPLKRELRPLPMLLV